MVGRADALRISGSRLARDGNTAICLTERSACIAGRPAPTGWGVCLISSLVDRSRLTDYVPGRRNSLTIFDVEHHLEKRRQAAQLLHKCPGTENTFRMIDQAHIVSVPGQYIVLIAGQ